MKAIAGLLALGTVVTVTAYAAEHFRVIQTLATQAGARTVDIDPASHRLYLPTARFGPKPAEPKQRAPMLPGSFSLLVVAPGP